MATGEIDLNDEAEIVLPEALAGSEESDELGQIRSLLFGEYAQRALERVERVESNVITLLHELREDMDSRFDDLDARLSTEVDVRTKVATNLVTRLDEEAQVRRDAQAGIREDFERTTDEINRQLADTRAELVDRIESTNADMRARNIDLRRVSDDLRGTLAVAFSNAADNLDALHG